MDNKNQNLENRRKFLKKLGIGTGAIFASSLIPANATVPNSGYFYLDNCISCGTCYDETVENCPVEAIKIGDTIYIQLEDCTHCGSCIDDGNSMCPTEAWTQFGNAL